jgi:hypothetical protein
VCSWYVIGQGALGETCRDMKRVSQIKCCWRRCFIAYAWMKIQKYFIT